MELRIKLETRMPELNMLEISSHEQHSTFGLNAVLGSALVSSLLRNTISAS
jgi:hypothetical protein